MEQIILGTLFLIFLLILRILHVQRKIRILSKKNEVLYNQTESLIKIHNLIKFRHPLPPFRNWAVSPDISLILISEILSNRPRTIVDFGSGISTLISRYSLDLMDNTENLERRIYSFDHEEKFVNATQNEISLHQFSWDPKIIYAPLNTIKIKDFDFEFYETTELDSITEIDLVFIDGPHGKNGILDRYPAIPVTFNKLSENGVIVIDDTKNFPESKKLVQMWRQEYPELHYEEIDTELGTVILRKKIRYEPYLP